MIKLYNFGKEVYDHYRECVPNYASPALAFYLLLILIPVVSLIAIGASALNIDMSLVERMISEVLVKEYASVVIDVLETRTFNSVALVTIIISIYTVSRGVGNIYEISNQMYLPDHEEGFFGYYVYVVKITIILLTIFLGVIAITALKPLASLFHIMYSLVGFRHILLYFLLTFAFMSIYLAVPRVKIKYADAFQGALCASALMLVLYYGLGIYFQFANFTTVYGPLAFVIVILFVFNLAAEIFYMGMYMTFLLHTRRERYEKRSRN